MSRVVFDEQAISQINGHTEPSEVVDSAGNVVGFLLKPELFADYRLAWELHEAHLDELDRRIREEPSYTLQEIRDELGVK